MTKEEDMAGEAKKSTARSTATASAAKTPAPPPAPDSATFEKLLDRLATAVEEIRTDRRGDAGAMQGVAERAVTAISNLRPAPVAQSFRVQEAIQEHEDLAKKLAGPDFGTTSRNPTITEVFPGHGPPGTRIVIQGRSLGDATSVRFGAAQGAPEGARPGRIEVVVPEQATSGRLTVVTARGSQAQSPQEFIVASEIVRSSDGAVKAPAG
jgi:hypothetical protein